MITGSPPTVMKVGTPASSTIFFALIPSPVEVGPTMAATLSLKMNFLAMTAVLAGSLSVSPMINSIGRPLMPPSLLILSATIWATSFVGVPMLAAGPDKAKKAPILMGSPAKDAEATTAQDQRNDDGNSRSHDHSPLFALDKTSLGYLTKQCALLLNTIRIVKRDFHDRL